MRISKKNKLEESLPVIPWIDAIIGIMVALPVLGVAWAFLGQESIYCAIVPSGSMQNHMIWFDKCIRSDMGGILLAINILFLPQLIASVAILFKNWIAWVSLIPPFSIILTEFFILLRGESLAISPEIVAIFLLVSIQPFLVIYYRRFFRFPFSFK